MRLPSATHLVVLVAGDRTENDGKVWEMTLRDGLKFHDGAKVLARDCVATIQRFSKRDPFGQAMMKRVDEVSAISDTSITSASISRFRYFVTLLHRYIAR